MLADITSLPFYKMAMLDFSHWAALPFHFWTVVFFVFGSVVGSFLNVCIHRLPHGQSLVFPSSHCPDCGTHIPWYLNIPLFSWLLLRGRCRACQARISPRYLLVELLTATLFAASWVTYGNTSIPLVFAYCLLFAGFIVATFIDLEHFIIPDEITIGGIVAGVIASFAAPELHATESRATAMQHSLLGIAVGGGIVYLILQAGKLAFGRQRLTLGPDTSLAFTETALRLPDQEIPYSEIFARKTDRIRLHAKRIELEDRCYFNANLSLSPTTLEIGSDRFDPESIHKLEAVTDEIVLPREAMGLGDVKFMAAIGAFLGYQGALFALMVSSVIGAVVGFFLVLIGRREWSSQIPYGPYIVAAATIWVFTGRQILDWWLGTGG